MIKLLNYDALRLLVTQWRTEGTLTDELTTNMLVALVNMTNYILSGERYREINPYFIPEVKDAMDVFKKLHMDD